MSSRFAASPSILNFMADSPNYGKLASVGATERMKNAAGQLLANAGIHTAAMSGEARKEAAKYSAEGTRARGEAAGFSSMVGGLASGIGSFASGFGSKGDPYFGQGTGEINTMVKQGFTPSTMYSGFPNQGLG